MNDNNIYRSGWFRKVVHGTYGYYLPKDYVFYVESNLQLERFIGAKYIAIWTYEEAMEFNESMDEFVRREQIFGIGSNGGGETIAIDFNKSGKIFIFNTISQERSEFIVIGDCFRDFIIRLESGLSWMAE